MSRSVSVGKTEIILGGLFFHGTVSGPEHNFTYGMIGLHVSPIPLGGAISLTDVRLLFAFNMTPNLGPLDSGAAPVMRLSNGTRRIKMLLHYRPIAIWVRVVGDLKLSRTRSPPQSKSKSARNA